MREQPDLQVISGRLERGEIDSAEYLEQLMRFVAAQIGCARAGLRLLVDGDHGRTLRCIAMYDVTQGRMIGAPDISHADGGVYFEQLLRDGHVTATPTASTDAAFADYLESTGVSAVMDMSFSVNGVLYGAFSCEQIGTPVEWTQRQLQSLRKIASRASLTLMHRITMSVDTAPGALWESSTPNRLATMPMPLDSSKD
ncbi:MAG: GAF domain-containing protein [Burkholderiales bacterium]